MYGSINGVKDNLPKLRKYIKPETDSTFQADLDISEKQVERVLTEISDQVNAALAAKYVVPFADPAPSVITLITNDLAAFKIARSYMTTISAEENHSLMALRKDAKEILAALVSGDYELNEAQKKDLDNTLEQLLGAEAEEIFDLEDEATWQDKI